MVPPNENTAALPVDNLIGYLDACLEPRRLLGWATTATPADAPLTVTLTVEGKPIGTTTADRFREDLCPYNDGYVSFDLETTADFAAVDLANGRAKLLALRDGRPLGLIPLGQGCRRAVAALRLKAALLHLHAGLEQIGPDALADFLTGPHSPIPPSTGILLQPFLAALATPDSAAFSDRMNDDPDGALRAVARAVVSRFTSLGDNCEFGLVQRHFGAEPQDLFRWGASSGGLRALNMGLGHRFSGVGQSMSLQVKGNEYMSFDNNYKYVFHTDRFVGVDDPDLLLRNEHKRVAYLARNLIEDLEAGQKTFVYKFSHSHEQPDLIDELVGGMAAIGNAALLWVSLARHPAQIGSVEKLRHNLFRGYIDRFSPVDQISEYCSYLVWLRLILETLRLQNRP